MTDAERDEAKWLWDRLGEFFRSYGSDPQEDPNKFFAAFEKHYRDKPVGGFVMRERGRIERVQ